MSEDDTKIGVDFGVGEDYSVICISRGKDVIHAAISEDREYEALVALGSAIEQLTADKSELEDRLKSIRRIYGDASSSDSEELWKCLNDIYEIARNKGE